MTTEAPRDRAQVREDPLYFPAAGAALFGILAAPVANPVVGGAVLVQGAGGVPATNHNRTWVRLARRLAAEGVRCLRFDPAGVGESTGALTRTDLDRQDASGLLAAMGVLRRSGGWSVLVGSCAGARLSVEVASTVPDVAGLVLLAPPVADLTGPAAVRFVRRCRDLTDRGLPVSFVYGTEDPYLVDFRRTVQEPLSRLADRRPELLQIVVLPRLQVWGLPSLAVQDDVIELCSERVHVALSVAHRRTVAG